MPAPRYLHYECSQELIKELEKPDVRIGSYIVNGDRKYERQLDSNKRIYIAELKLGLLERLWHRLGLGYASYKTVWPNTNSGMNVGLRYDIFSPTAPTENRSELNERYQQQKWKRSLALPIGVGGGGAQNLSHYQENDTFKKGSVVKYSIPEATPNTLPTDRYVDQTEEAAKLRLFSTELFAMTNVKIEYDINSDDEDFNKLVQSEINKSNFYPETPRKSLEAQKRFDLHTIFNEPDISNQNPESTVRKISSSNLQVPAIQKEYKPHSEFKELFKTF